MLKPVKNGTCTLVVVKTFVFFVIMLRFHQLAVKSCRVATALDSLSTTRCYSNAQSDFSLPDLPYDYGALEPVLPAKIMELHHSKVSLYY